MLFKEKTMKKKNILLGTGLALTVSATALSCVLLNKNVKFLSGKAANDYWTIEFEADKIFDTDRATNGAIVEEYFETGSAVVKTKENQNDVTLAYNNVYRYDFNGIKWMETKANSEGYIYNVNPINSMLEVRIYFGGTFTMEWGWEKNDGDIVYEGSKTIEHYSQYSTFDFDGQKPNYFRFKNSGTDKGTMASFRIHLDKACVPGTKPNA